MSFIGVRGTCPLLFPQDRSSRLLPYTRFSKPRDGAAHRRGNGTTAGMRQKIARFLRRCGLQLPPCLDPIKSAVPRPTSPPRVKITRWGVGGLSTGHGLAAPFFSAYTAFANGQVAIRMAIGAAPVDILLRICGGYRLRACAALTPCLVLLSGTRPVFNHSPLDIRRGSSPGCHSCWLPFLFWFRDRGYYACRYGEGRPFSCFPNAERFGIMKRWPHFVALVRRSCQNNGTSRTHRVLLSRDVAPIRGRAIFTTPRQP